MYSVCQKCAAIFMLSSSQETYNNIWASRKKYKALWNQAHQRSRELRYLPNDLESKNWWSGRQAKMAETHPETKLTGTWSWVSQ